MTASDLTKVPIGQQLAALTGDAHLSANLVAEITTTFSPLFAQAQGLFDEAAAIAVTDASDLKGMEHAGEIRKTMKSLRGVLEKHRVRMTADALKTKATIDMVSRTLREELEDAEGYLAEQENYAARLQAQREEKLRAERAEQMNALGCDPSVHSLGTMPERSWGLLLAACQGEAKLREEEERQARDKAAAQETARQEELAKARAENERLRHEKTVADEQARIAGAKARAAQERLQAEKDAAEEQAREQRREDFLKAQKEREDRQRKEDEERRATKAAADKKLANEARKRKAAEAASGDLLAACKEAESFLEMERDKFIRDNSSTDGLDEEAKASVAEFDEILGTLAQAIGKAQWGVS